MVRGAVLALLEAERALVGGSEDTAVGEKSILEAALGGVAEEGLEGEEDGYYSSEEEGDIAEGAAAAGLGEAGEVTVHQSLWDRLVPRGLAAVYAQSQGGGGVRIALPKAATDDASHPGRYEGGQAHKAAPHRPSVFTPEKSGEMSYDFRRHPNK